MRLNVFLGCLMLVLAGWFYLGDPTHTLWPDMIGTSFRSLINQGVAWQPYTSIVMVVLAIGFFITLKPYD